MRLNCYLMASESNYTMACEKNRTKLFRISRTISRAFGGSQILANRGQHQKWLKEKRIRDQKRREDYLKNKQNSLEVCNKSGQSEQMLDSTRRTSYAQSSLHPGLKQTDLFEPGGQAVTVRNGLQDP